MAIIDLTERTLSKSTLTSLSARWTRSLSAAAGISSIPTLMAFRDGILVFSQPGALPAPALEQVITAVRASTWTMFAHVWLSKKKRPSAELGVGGVSASPHNRIH